MGQTVTLGGDRLGSGNKNKIYLHGYERSTHDLGSIFRTTMSAGTLVPFMVLPALPGDTWDIDLNAIVKTLPTVGPMFGSLKLQLDVFKCDQRLYHAWLHNNKLKIGNNMSRVKLPQIEMYSANPVYNGAVPIDIQQINPSSLLAYLGIRAIGKDTTSLDGTIRKQFNALPLLMYLDIFKNYYASKVEENAHFIHTAAPQHSEMLEFKVYKQNMLINSGQNTKSFGDIELSVSINSLYRIEIKFPKGTFNGNESEVGGNTIFVMGNSDELSIDNIAINSIYDPNISHEYDLVIINGLKTLSGYDSLTGVSFNNDIIIDNGIQITQFPLEQLDVLREDILTRARETTPMILDNGSNCELISQILEVAENNYPNSQFSQEGLLLKTYQSDIFNNWINTDWVDGDNGVNEVTRISTVGDYFTLDTLQLTRKVYDMLNRIAVSGGSYNDWIVAVYDNENYARTEIPVYCGGLSKEIVFGEIVSTAKVDENNPLGSLAGKGGMSGKHKGGKVHIKVSEPAYIIGIVSITPRIDYSQGNEWHTHIKTMDDWHKPPMDEIGFQELITEDFAALDSNGNTKFSAGKQPAWINYQTDKNQCYGNFADPRREMFMTFNRRWTYDENLRVKDITQYIDPSKYNYIFAQTSLDSMNYWVQIAKDIVCRRKMSARLMPNL